MTLYIDIYYNQLIDDNEFSWVLIFCLLCPSIFDRGINISLTMILDSSISLYSSIRFCLIYFDSLFLGTYTLRIIMSSWRIHSIIIIWCPSLSLITFFGLKSALSEINIAFPAFSKLALIYIFLHLFTFNLHLLLYLK